MSLLNDLYWSTTSRFRVPKQLEALLRDCRSVLDLGCGWKPHECLRDKHAVGVDAFKPSIERAAQSGIYNELIQSDIFDAVGQFETNSFDAVTSFDVIEHLDKDDGLKMIQEMLRIGRKRVVILTPNGYVNQDEYDDNPLQVHRSGWSAAQMADLGFAVAPINGVKWLRGEECQLVAKPRFVGQLLSDMSIGITLLFPGLAYQILCSQDVESSR